MAFFSCKSCPIAGIPFSIVWRYLRLERLPRPRCRELLRSRRLASVRWGHPFPGTKVMATRWRVGDSCIQSLRNSRSRKKVKVQTHASFFLSFSRECVFTLQTYVRRRVLHAFHFLSFLTVEEYSYQMNVQISDGTRR